MLEKPRLDPVQIEAYRRDGFVVARAAFDAATMERIGSWASELAQRPEESGRHWVYHERSRLDRERELISRIENICPFHPGFAELAEVLRPSADQLLGEEAVLFKEKINFKMPGGDGFKPHQDSQAGWEKYARSFVSVALCIDEATVENGCLKLAAGHQKRGLFRPFEPPSDEEMAGMDQIRRMYLATYNKRSEGDHLVQYYADKHRSYPPDIDREPDRAYVFRV